MITDTKSLCSSSLISSDTLLVFHKEKTTDAIMFCVFSMIMRDAAIAYASIKFARGTVRISRGAIHPYGKLINH